MESDPHQDDPIKKMESDPENPENPENPESLEASD